MERFNITNSFRDISLNQFKKAAIKLEDSLIKVRPTISSGIITVPNEEAYKIWNQISDKEALKIQRDFSLDELDQEIWRSSSFTQFYIEDLTTPRQYLVALTVEDISPKTLQYGAQALDSESRREYRKFNPEKIKKKKSFFEY